MKHLKTLLLLIALVVPLDILSSPAVQAQTTYTPNLNLALPPAAPNTWGEQYNNNFSTLDGRFPGGKAGHTLQDENVDLPPRSKLNFKGPGVTAADSPGTDSTDVTITGGGSGGGHTIQDETKALPQRTNLNFTGGGVTCLDNSAQDRTDCAVPAGVVDQTASYVWTGPNTWRDNSWSLLNSGDLTKILKFDLSGITTGTTRTLTVPNASTRLLGDSDFSTTGIMSRTALNTYAGRSLLSGNANYLAWTNGDGVSGNPSINIGANVVATDRANTYTAGSKQIFTPSATTSGFNLGSLAGDPSAPANGDVWYNSSTNTFRKRQNGSTTDLDTTGGSVAFSAVTAGTNVNALLIGNSGSLNSTGTGTITANRTPCTTGQYLAFDGSCATAGTSVDQTAAYTWTGAHSWRDNNFSLLDDGDTSKVLKFDLAGFTTATTRTWTGPNASTRLIGDSDFASTNGFMVRTGSGTYASRNFQGTPNRITISNTGGAGDPTFNLGSLAVQTDQSNAYSTGDQSFANALSLTAPLATGAAPTGFGRFAFNLTNNRFVGGNGTVTKTFAFTDEIQPLNSNLTALAGLTGASGRIPYFSGAGAMAVASAVLCTDTAGQHLNITSLSPLTFTCGSSGSAGLSGLSAGKYVFATGATTADTSGSLTESGGVVSAPTGLTVGDQTDNINFIRTAYAGHGSVNITWPYVGGAASVALTTGALTTGHVATFGANGQIVDGGAISGTGTVTSVATTGPITGGTITTTGTIACATCVTSAAALTSNRLVLGAGSQASAVLGSLGTTTTVLHGNAAGAPTFAAVDIVADTTGTLTVAKGGSGATTLTGVVRGNGASAMTAAELSGDVTTSGSNATTIANNAVTSAKTAVVNTRRTCMIVVGDGTNAIATSDLSPFKQGRCYVPYAATVVEVTLQGDTGTASVLLQRRRDAATVADLLSGALASNGTTETCALSGTAGTCINGTTSSGSITTSNTSLAAGDWIEVKSGTGALSTTSLSIAVVFTVN